MNRKHGIYMAVAVVALAGWLWLSGLPLTSLLVYAVLLACPVMMLFMMRGMNHADMGHHPAATPEKTGIEDARDSRLPHA